jgi:hypothetical protein
MEPGFGAMSLKELGLTGRRYRVEMQGGARGNQRTGSRRGVGVGVEERMNSDVH